MSRSNSRIGARERFAEIRDEGRTPMGTFVGLSDAAITEIAASAGLDFAIYDCEHSPMGVVETLNHVRAAEACGLVPLVRIWENSRALIQKFLDVGAEGIVVPHVETAQEARAAVRATRFPSGGERSYCPLIHATHYSHADWGEYRAHTERNMLVIPIIESVRAVQNIDEIVAVDGIDLPFFGPGDFSSDAGISFDSPELKKAWNTVVTAARAHGKSAMTSTLPWAEPGQAGALVHGMDLSIISMAMRAEVDELKRRYQAAADHASGKAG